MAAAKKKKGKGKKRRHVSKPKPVRKALGAIGLFSQSVKSALDLHLFVVPLLSIVLILVALLGITIVSAPFLVFGIVGLATGGMGIVLLPLGAVIFTVLFIIASAVINGFYFKSVDQFLKTGKVSFEENIGFALGKWKTLTGVMVLHSIVVAAIAAVTILPAIALVLGQALAQGPLFPLTALQGQAPAAVASLLLLLAAGVLAFFLASLLLRPLLFLWFPAAVLEKKPAMECISRGFEKGKKRYVRNLGALFLLGLLGTLATGLQMVDPTIVIGIVIALWVELVGTVLAVKAYRERK